MEEIFPFMEEYKAVDVLSTVITLSVRFVLFFHKITEVLGILSYKREMCLYVKK